MSRKDFRLVEGVPVDDILLDVGNARIRDGHDQNDCIARILRKEDQLLALMRDIAEKELTTMPILVKPTADGKYVVMDGNRRITALKLLNHPQLCPVPRLADSIKALRKSNKATIPTTVDVQASSNDQAIAREVLARHSGAQGGVGQLDWSAYLRTVFLLNHGHPPEYKRPGQYAMWAEKQGVVVSDEFPITSLQRFFTVENLALLGFKVVDDELVPIIGIDVAKHMSQILVTDFATSTKVDNVRTPDLARDYIQTVRGRAGLQPAPVVAPGTNPSDAGELDAAEWLLGVKSEVNDDIRTSRYVAGAGRNAPEGVSHPQDVSMGSDETVWSIADEPSHSRFGDEGANDRRGVARAPSQGDSARSRDVAARIDRTE